MYLVTYLGLVFIFNLTAWLTFFSYPSFQWVQITTYTFTTSQILITSIPLPMLFPKHSQFSSRCSHWTFLQVQSHDNATVVAILSSPVLAWTSWATSQGPLVGCWSALLTCTSSGPCLPHCLVPAAVQQGMEAECEFYFTLFPRTV